MPHIESFERRPRAAGEAGAGVDILWNGVRLVASAERVVAEEDEAQLSVCDHCGTPGCAAGGWVAFRRVHDHIAMLPAFERMLRDPDWSVPHFWPPPYLVAGMPTVLSWSADAWAHLRSVVPSLREARDVQAPTARELALLLQWMAPASLLGTFPGPVALCEDALMAVSHGEHDDAVRDLRTGLAAALRHETPLQSASGVEVEFTLDLPGMPSWSPLLHVDGRLALHSTALPGLIPG